MVSQVSCYSTGTFDMYGMQIDEERKVMPNGRVMFGSNFILDKGNSFEFIIQSLPVDEKTKKIVLNAKSQRGARMELNKMFPRLRDAYNKPRFVSLEEFEKAIAKRDFVIKRVDGNNRFKAAQNELYRKYEAGEIDSHEELERLVVEAETKYKVLEDQN